MKYGGEKAPTRVRLSSIAEVRLSFNYCTQVRPPGSWRTQRKWRKEEGISSLFLNCVQPPSQTTGSHKTEFVFDVRQFGVLQRAQLHFSTPVLYTEQLKTTSKKNPTKKEREKKKNEI